MTPIYVHIPYCESKCPYCDFASVGIDGGVDAYLNAVAREAVNASRRVSTAETIYIGGGTPTVLSPDQLRWLLELLGEQFRISPLAEITVEANPGSLTPEKVRALAAGGVNRVSLGAQSFVDAELSFLGRLHEAGHIGNSFSLLREGGIGNISLDLIYAIPNQSMESWRYSLAKTIELNPEHISTYCLTFERQTPFWQSLQRGKIQKKSDEEELELYEMAREMLTGAGYNHYEISNFALPGMHSVHNTVYWSNREYLGLGSSAVSYLDGARIANLRNPEAYIREMECRGSAVGEVEKIPPRMQAIETLIQRLRMRHGVDCSAFRNQFGVLPQEIFGETLEELVSLGLLEHTADTIKSSLNGWHLANEVALKILP